MSIESAKLFIDRLKADEDFARKVMSYKDTDSRMDFVKSLGFDFTAQEVKAVSSELSDTDLDNVTGGYGFYTEDGVFHCLVLSS